MTRHIGLTEKTPDKELTERYRQQLETEVNDTVGPRFCILSVLLVILYTA